MTSLEQELKANTELFGANALYIAEIYERYLENPTSVDEQWQSYFANLGDNIDNIERDFGGPEWSNNKSKVVGYVDPEAARSAKSKATANQNEDHTESTLSIRAHMLIRAYRVRGHLLATLDPLGLKQRTSHPELDPAHYGLVDEDMDKEIFLDGWLGKESATLAEILEILRQSYSQNFAVEFIHIQSLERKQWLEERIESSRGKPTLSLEQRKKILQQLVEVVGFEEFLHKKFPGAKRFSAEGGENLMAAMEACVSTAAGLGVQDVVLGMPHRGRLNVLTNFMQKSYAAMLSEFAGNLAIPEHLEVSGDVKYHLGISADRKFLTPKGEEKEVHLSLNPNPSHLEAVNPVVMGKVRARQDQRKDWNRETALAILLHGDAAFCGQGVVAEGLALNDLEGYKIGGTFHIVVNNQIGFTTTPEEGHTSPYPTDVAMMIQAPIFHVNGDDPEAVFHAATIAAEYRQKFQKDVVLDIICYRKHGHNEGDEPMFTQPLMYQKIATKDSPRDVYAKRLIAENAITQDEYQKMQDDWYSFLEKEHETSQSYKPNKADWLEGRWEGMKHVTQGEQPILETGVKLDILKEIGMKISEKPDHVNLNKKVARMLDQKRKMIETGDNLDWATGEALAFGSLLLDGHPIRMTGQDAIRGTFSHRHSGFTDQKSEEKYFPLKNLNAEQARLEIVNSNLSEYAVLGYEYGYSTAEPKGLTIWEGQFGDFVNGAQIIIDQFICSAETKWLRMSGLIMLLPHGYEGQGPEHSSARLERFLQLSAEDNWIVANCTTPANYFHILRRQLTRDFRKPLILMTPKSLLRHKRAVSTLAEMQEGTHFRRVIEEIEQPGKNINKDDKIRKVLICSGKVYYDILEAREERNIKDIAIIRLEQFYPFPESALLNELKRYKNAQTFWVQEEPENMGAWNFLDRRIEQALVKAKAKHTRPTYIGRPAAAASAAGYMKLHKVEQAKIVDEALG